MERRTSIVLAYRRFSAVGTIVDCAGLKSQISQLEGGIYLFGGCSTGLTLAITPLGRREAEDGGLGWEGVVQLYRLRVRVFVLTQRLLPVCCARETASRGGLHGCGRRPIAQHRVARHVPPLARPQREVLRAVKGRSGEQRSELL